MCGTALSEVDLKDMKYTKCACPGCKTVATIDPFATESLRDYVGPHATSVQVCKDCDCLVAHCPKCREK